MLLLFVANGCGKPNVTLDELALDRIDLRTVAVLPFQSTESAPGDADRTEFLRRVIADELASTHGFAVLSPARTASLLRHHGIATPSRSADWKFDQMKPLSVDAVLVGDVEPYTRLQTFLYTRETVSADLRLVATNTNKPLWTGHYEMNTRGGLLLENTQIITWLRSLTNTSDEVFAERVYEFARTIVATIPMPHKKAGESPKPPFEKLECTIRGDAPLRDGDLIELFAIGPHGMTVVAQFDDTYSVRLAEESRGMYRASWLLSRGIEERWTGVTFHLIAPWGERDDQTHPIDIHIDSAPPELKSATLAPDAIVVEAHRPDEVQMYLLLNGAETIATSSDPRFDLPADVSGIWFCAAIDDAGNQSYPLPVVRAEVAP